MAPLVCRVVDTAAIGIQGIYAILECKDQLGNILAKFESFSDDGGNIHYWFQFSPAGEIAELTPEIIDALQFPTLNLTFRPGLKEAYFPWLSIRTELRLSCGGRHEFILFLHTHSASYQLEHAITPELLPTNIDMEWESSLKELDMFDVDPTAQRSPSPLELPPPIIPPCREVALQEKRGLKRKLTAEVDDTNECESPSKRRQIAPRKRNRM